MAFSDHFVGVPQSRWAGYAILAAIIAVALAVLFGKDQIPVGQRVLVILIMFLFALPTIALVLFQITCLVNGTSKAPFCGWYAWIVAALTILYCVLLIVVAITMKSTDVAVSENFAVSYEDANKMAKKMLGGAEGFEDMDDEEGFEDMDEEEAFEAKGVAPKPADKKPVVADKKPMVPVKPVAPVAKPPVVSAGAKPQGEKKEKFVNDEDTEEFADYGFGAAPVSAGPSMYML